MTITPRTVRDDELGTGGRDVPSGMPDRAEDYLRATMESSGAAFIVLDATLRIRDHNRALLAQCGEARRSLAGEPLIGLVHPSIRSVLLRHLERLAQRQAKIVIENLTALWTADSDRSGTVVAIANHGASGHVESILVMVNLEEAIDERRTLIRPTRLLSKVNAQILEGVAAGAPTVQLASRLYLSRQGVEYHVSNMLRQFRVPNRAALVSKSYSMGMFRVGSWPPRVLTDYVRS